MRFATITALLTVALLSFVAGPQSAFAASACRTDPILVLSNGAEVQLASSIGTEYSNVQSVVYTVHAPRGTFVLLTIYTDNPLGSKERVQFYADQPSNTYTTDTVVNTVRGNANVTATGLLVSALRITLARGNASGMTNQHIYMPLHR
jgi:phage gp46-like protein